MATRAGKYPHVEWIDLNNNGIAVEVAVLKRDSQGGVYFIRLDALDSIDKSRMAKILTNRNAPNFELWDLMSQITLGNGENALKYFHQLVRIKTPQGEIIRPAHGRIGVAQPQVAPKSRKAATAE